MTEIEMEKLKAICKIANVDDIEDLSDGYHTFRQLYYQRMILFAAIVKQNKDKAWKSLRHEDGELCFGGGWFIVGVDTPEGSYTYHYEDNYFSLFDCEELACGKHWDGHTEKDVTRLLSLQPKQKHGRWLKTGQSFVKPSKFRNYCCSECGWELDEHIRVEPHYCPNCGAKMDETDDKYVTLHHEDIHFIDEDAERAFYESLVEEILEDDWDD